MKLLILGGTKFIGRHLAEASLARGHELTLFNRGRLNPGIFPEVEKLQGERDGGLGVLAGRNWHAVIDTCGYVPRLVAASARLLADRVEHYTFISSISVYPDFSKPGLNEDSPVAEAEDPTTEDHLGPNYGPLKVLCERAAEAALPGRVLQIRPCIVAGPYDPTDRFTYWVARLARGGPVLAPGSPDAPVEYIDARDLAAWLLDLVEQRHTGTYNAAGPDCRLTMGELLAACQAAGGSDARLVWASEDFLAAHDVELPLWVAADSPGFFTVDNSRALAAGLRIRPVAETIQDTLAWDRTRPADEPRKAGLSPERERELLQLLS